ncbi:predicted protein [Naegleria gruberi]|uniref:Predicted protein n=1 Tax=Naegleria gruberi TaxID=5762 RepID=D2VYZ5_NAEGR|nr:uncharacterized protein NAEGRDRAFT_74298 [Naegleria gruberi]EFC38045.1 predicted protein [Naegleria gruberi]|eukprot:XP_002670789.1 predicted protein [Naegleria gruberi strain NEG-M]
MSHSFQDLSFNFPTPTNLFQLFSNHINLKSYNPTLTFQSYHTIKSFRAYARIAPSRSSPYPSYHIGVCPQFSWIILLISLQGKITIAFVDLKTNLLIKVVRLGSGNVLCAAFSQIDDSRIGTDLYLFEYDFNLYKYDLESIFNFKPNTSFFTFVKSPPETPQPIWKVSSHINNNREIYKGTTLNIVKMEENFTLMLCDGSHFAYYSIIDGSLIKIDSNEKEMQLNIKSIQDGTILSENDRIIYLNNQNELCWIELKTLKITHKAKLDFEPKYGTLIRVDEFSRQIILCEGVGHFSVVNWDGKLVKTFQVPPNSQPKNEPLMGYLSKHYYCSPVIYQKSGELFYCHEYILARIK